MKFNQARSDQIALELTKCTYEEGARGPTKVDCIGVVILYLRSFGVDIPNSIDLEDWKNYDFEPAGVLQRLFRKLGSEEPLETGDVLTFYRGPCKVSSAIDTLGLYLGAGQRFIHAGLNFDPVSLQMSLMPRFGVYVQSLKEEHWLNRIYAVYRARL